LQGLVWDALHINKNVYHLQAAGRTQGMRGFKAWDHPRVYYPASRTGHVRVTIKRVTINALVDIGCLLTFIPSLITGLVLYLVLPSGGGRGSSWVTYSGITRLDWVNLRNYTSLAFATLLIIHMLLHWRFFRNIRKTLGKNAKEPCVMTEVPL